MDYYTADVVSYSDYYPFGMTMPNRNGGTDEYRYEFGGMEDDSEISGDNNSYDFGARLYNPRIGRFFSLDPKESNYPFMSPYCYAANSPIRYIDVNGEGPGDPVVYLSAKAKKGNVIVYLVDENYDFVVPENVSLDEWDIIAVSNLKYANEIISDCTDGAGDVHNLIIRTHGTMYGNVRVENTTTGEDYMVANMTPDNFYGNFNEQHDDAEFKKEQLEAFKGIFSYLGENANICMIACNGGVSNLGEAIHNIATEQSDASSVTVYTNADHSKASKKNPAEKTETFRFDQELTISLEDERNGYYDGWKTTTVNSNGVIETNPVEDNHVPVINSTTGDIEWDERLIYPNYKDASIGSSNGRPIVKAKVSDAPKPKSKQ